MRKPHASSAAIALTSALLALTAACGDSKPSRPVQPTVVATAVAPATAPAGTNATTVPPTIAARANPPAAPRVSPAQATAAPSPATPAAGDGPDPCALVTQPEAEAVLGGASAAPRTQRTALLSQCQYAPAGPNDDPTDAVTVQIFPSSGPLTWPLRRDTFKKTNPTVQAVAGVGDEAFWVGDQSALFVTSRGVIFDVRVPGSGATALANAKALAQKAVARLG